MESELAAMLNFTVSVEVYTGLDTYGNPAYDDPAEIAGFVDSLTTTVGSQGGRRDTLTWDKDTSIPLLVVDSAADPVPSVNDRVTINGYLFDVDEAVLFYDDGEPHHYEIRLDIRK